MKPAQRPTGRRSRYSQERADWLAGLKSQPCPDCGRLYPPVCMDFDHVRGKKLFGIGHGWHTRALKAVEAEIAKCEVVCSNCHRIRTALRKHHGRQ
jgi:hypothetical protein